MSSQVEGTLKPDSLQQGVQKLFPLIHMATEAMGRHSNEGCWMTKQKSLPLLGPALVFPSQSLWSPNQPKALFVSKFCYLINIR